MLVPLACRRMCCTPGANVEGLLCLDTRFLSGIHCPGICCCMPVHTLAHVRTAPALDVYTLTFAGRLFRLMRCRSASVRTRYMVRVLAPKRKHWSCMGVAHDLGCCSTFSHKVQLCASVASPQYVLACSPTPDSVTHLVTAYKQLESVCV